MAFACNLLGAVFGGALEYLALITGYQALLILVAGAVCAGLALRDATAPGRRQGAGGLDELHGRFGRATHAGTDAHATGAGDLASAATRSLHEKALGDHRGLLSGRRYWRMTDGQLMVASIATPSAVVPVA